MDALVFAVVVVVCSVVGWAVRAVAGDRPILGNIWRYRPPSWPHGVQEDDDMHWRWRGGARGSDRAPTERLRPHLGFGPRLDRGGRQPR